MIKLKYITFLFLLGISINANAQKKNDKRTLEWRYEIQCQGIGTDGNYLVKVFSYSDSKSLSTEAATKNAIHGVLFKGIPGDRNNGCYSQKPICTNPNVEFEKKEFFDTFFQDGGKYMKYVQLTGAGVAANDRIKMGKDYKIGMVVTVAKDLLRADMEAAGIIKSLKDF